MTRLEQARDALLELELREILGAERRSASPSPSPSNPTAPPPTRSRWLEWAAVLALGVSATTWIALSRPDPLLQTGQDRRPEIVRVDSRTALERVSKKTRHLEIHKLVDGELDALPRLRELRRLTITGGFRGVDPATSDAYLTDASVDLLVRLPKLETLQLMLCPRFTGSRMGELARLPMLRSLEFFAQAVPAGAFDALRKLPALDTLTFDSCPLDDDRLERLARLRGLRRLLLSNVSGVTERGLLQLGGMRELRRIGLRGLDCVTERVLDSLGKLPKLTHLDLRRVTTLTDDAVIDLVDEWRRCEVVLPSGKRLVRR